ncbi:MAG: hypothetical protein WAL91_12770 [Propionicimonas sp.]
MSDSPEPTPTAGAETVDTALAAGAFTTLDASGGQAALLDATGRRVHVVTTDVSASNGVIRVIDAVPLPAA